MIKRILIGVLFLLPFAGQSVFAQTEQGELSPTQAWIEGIEDVSGGYSSWVHGIQPPEAPAEEETGIDAAINSFTAPIAALVGKIVFFKIPVFGAQLPLVVLWLVIGAIFFTIYLGFINLRGFKHAIELVRGRLRRPQQSR